MLAKNLLSGITTIGGRSTVETEIDRLVREILEELRGIIDYSEHKELLYECMSNGKDNKCIRYDGCYYCFIKVEMEFMESIKAEFPKIQTNRDVCNELSSIEIISTKEIIMDMVSKKQTEYSDKDILIFDNFEVKRRKYTETFERMFMSVGYDTLHGIHHNKQAEQLNIQAEITSKIQDIPLYVSIRPYKVLMPNVYGIIHKGTVICSKQTQEGEKTETISMTLYIGDQYYFETKEYIVYRNGVHNKKKLLDSNRSS